MSWWPGMKAWQARQEAKRKINDLAREAKLSFNSGNLKLNEVNLEDMTKKLDRLRELDKKRDKAMNKLHAKQEERNLIEEMQHLLKKKYCEPNAGILPSAEQVRLAKLEQLIHARLRDQQQQQYSSKTISQQQQQAIGSLTQEHMTRLDEIDRYAAKMGAYGPGYLTPNEVREKENLPPVPERNYAPEPEPEPISLLEEDAIECIPEEMM